MRPADTSSTLSDAIDMRRVMSIAPKPTQFTESQPLNGRARALALEQAIGAELPLLEGEVLHHHSFGVYGRELRVKAGSVIVGHIHKYENMNVLLEGEMTVTTDDGPVRVGPGFLVVSPPGTKRAAYAHTDCRWLTVHGTHETDLEKIEQQFIVHTEQEYLEFCERQLLLKGD